MHPHPVSPGAASPAALATANQASWFAASATALGGGEDVTPIGRRTRIPASEDADDGEVRLVTLAPLDRSEADVGAIAAEIVESARDDLSIASMSCWAGDDGSNGTLGTSLLARGFSWGFQPGWMHVDTGSDVDLAVADIAGIAIAEVTGDVEWDAPDLPNYDRRLGRSFSRLVTGRGDGSATAIFCATNRDGQVVGLIAIHAQPEAHGRRVAGVYECGVDPRHRRRGIGRALTATAVRWAIARACTDVTLNATPMGALVYPLVGFRHVGAGQTWWIRRDALDRAPAPAAETRLVEAIGRGSLSALSSGDLAAVDLDAPLWCGRTAVEGAALVRSAESAHHLTGIGATVDVISAWDLGWRSLVPELLAARPDLVNRPGGEHGATPLHVAIERDDRELFDLMLDAGPDLTLVDRTFGGTARGWAAHLGRPDLLAALDSR